MILVENLTKSYGALCAVNNISFTVDRGEILGLLGPNGAGKTTTLNILSCFLHPSSGRAMVAGHDCVLEPIEVTRRIGYLPENPPLYDGMRVEEYLRFAAEIKGVEAARQKSRVDYTLEATGIMKRRRSLISTLSKGYRQRLGLAAAIVHDPEVLILDEPTIGLDPNQIVEIRHLIRSLAESRTVILSTHILPEVELVCRRAAIINEGRIAAIDTIAHLRNRFRGTQVLEIEAMGDEAQIQKGLHDIPGVTTVERKGTGKEGIRYAIEAEADAALRRAVFETAVARQWILLEMRSQELSLEDVFAKLTRDEKAEPPRT